MKTLSDLEYQVKQCTACDLCKERINTVFSRGSSKGKIIILGEAPGKDEAEQGKPFVGRSGKLLDETLSSIGLSPENDIYVCNVIKCRPPGNRTPTDDEINSCLDFFEEQVKLVETKVVLALGNTAAGTITNSTFGITKIRGKIFKIKRLDKLVIPTFHPSYILRGGGIGSERHKLFVEDIQFALDYC